jgi:hypothetical protein
MLNRFIAAIAIMICQLNATAASAQTSSTAGRVALELLKAAAKPLKNPASRTAGKISSALQSGYRSAASLWPGGSNRIDQIALELKPPKNHCSLSTDGEKERQLFATLAEPLNGKLQVAQFALPCKDLTGFWQGKALSRWSMYTVDTTELPVGGTRMKFVVEMTKELPELKLSDVSKLTQQKPQIDVFGIIDTTPEAIFVGSVGREADETGPNRMIAGVTALTLISNRVVALNVYSEFKSRKTMDELLLEAKDVLARSTQAADNTTVKK